jgi:NTP pyrophosphatase (non-canonical NTP hydrolase)
LAGLPAPCAGNRANFVLGLPFHRVEISDFQALMRRTYGERDRARGVPATVAWLTEELGELAQAVRKGTREDQQRELGDVLAWLASLADQLGLSLDDAADRYASGCPRCGRSPCTC